MLKFRLNQGKLSDKTYENYKRTLLFFGKKYRKIAIFQIEKKMKSKKGLSLSVINLLKGAIKNFSIEARENTLKFLNQINKLSNETIRSSSQRKEPILLKDLDIIEERLFDNQCSIPWKEKTKIKLFSHLILNFYTGMRSIELCNVNYIGEDTVTISNGSKKIRIIIKTKKTKTNNQEETYYINVTNEDHKNLILSINVNDIYTLWSYRNRIHSLFQTIDYKNYSTHSFRSGFITQALLNGNDIRNIQSVTKHKSIPILMSYDKRVLDKDYVNIQLINS